MKRQIPAFAVLLVAIVWSLYATPRSVPIVEVVEAAADCDTTRAACSTMSYNLYNLCIGLGNDQSYCSFQRTSVFESCVDSTSNGTCSPYGD